MSYLQDEDIHFTRVSALEDLLDRSGHPTEAYCSVARVKRKGEEQVGRCALGEIGDPIAWLTAVVAPLMANASRLKARVRVFRPGGDKLGDLTTTVTRPRGSGGIAALPSPQGTAEPGGMPMAPSLPQGAGPLGPAVALAHGEVRGWDASMLSPGFGLAQPDGGEPLRIANARIATLEASLARSEDRCHRFEASNDRWREGQDHLRSYVGRVVESRDRLRDKIVVVTGERDEARQVAAMAVTEARRLRSERDTARASKKEERARRREAESERDRAHRDLDDHVETEIDVWADRSLAGRITRFLGPSGSWDDQD